MTMGRVEQKEQTRRRLIDAALQLSAERGFGALGLREIARESGITATGFYRHFRDLEELGLVLVDEVALALRQLIREARNRFRESGGRTRASVEAFMDFAHQKPHLFRLLLGERLGGSTAFRTALRKEIDRFVAELSDDLEAQARAAKQPTHDIPFAAEAIVAIVFSVGAEVLELPRHRHPGLADRLIREVYLVLRGAGFPVESSRPGESARPSRAR
jgi:TetR/AcrR family transcriptional regulator, fatty acid biosynthesis regulator